MKRLFAYDPENPRREGVIGLLCQHIRAEGRMVQITVGEPTRTLEQNERLWALLNDVSKQVQWPVDGKLQFLAAEDWKHILSAGLKHEQRVAQGIEGGFVILGQRTSQMGKRELSDLMDLIEAFGAEHGVEWNEPRAKAA